MKIWKSVLFLFAVMGLLALVAGVFPQDGFSVGAVRLKFPTLGEFLAPSEDLASAEEEAVDTLSTEELMRLRLESLKAEKMSEFMAYCESNPARIYMPGGDEAYLDPVFDALENARNERVRIVHYGDSQLECDRISADLREELQSAFGGSGAGMVPAVQTIPTYTLAQTAHPEGMSRHLAYGPAAMRLKSGAYGPMAQTVTVAGSASFTFATRGGKNYPHAGTFDKMTLLASAPVRATVVAGKDTVRMETADTTGAVLFYTARFARPQRKVSLAVKGNADIHGILFDGKEGVSLDNVPMRGCSGTIFTQITAATLRPFYAKERVRLVILQYGGNSVPYLKSDKAVDGYMRQIKSQIDYLKSVAPDACFLFIGPSDMSTSIDGVMQTYPMLPKIVKALRRTANECGIAFWDLYASMGGRNSMVKWVQSSLAGSDYVHFTPKGARNMAHILYETLQFYHKFYRFRTGKDQVELAADSLQAQSGELSQRADSVSVR